MSQTSIAEIRSFNRFYTRIIGLLDRYVLNSNFTLPEVRVLYELYHHKPMLSQEIIALIDIDKGYLSRLLLQFEKKKLIVKKRSTDDGRSIYISLTAKGKKEFEQLNQVSEEQIKQILAPLSPQDHQSLVYHMSKIKEILSTSTGGSTSIEDKSH
jgi:DNA-binding MarR family transcriptional regulator